MKEKSNIEDWSPLYTLVKGLIPNATLAKKNKAKSWEYGYNKEFDLVIISKDGTIGDIYEIEGLRIAIPSTPKKINYEHNKWVREDVPKELDRIKSIHEWNNKDREFRSKHVSYIEEEYRRRNEGFWFINNKRPTYVTGKNYMYLQHSKIDVGYPDFREANRVLFIYWEAAIADPRCFGIVYLKIRRSGFSFMSSSESVEEATKIRNGRVGVLSKTGDDAKKLFTNKIVYISNSYPFFFKPIMSGMSKPKTELVYDIPAKKITKNNMHDVDDIDMQEGLNTSVDWKATNSNSYDGEKLQRLIHDESGKWEKPENVKKNWGVTKTCLRVGRKIIGKCMMGSTCNPLDRGGQEFKDIYYSSVPIDRSKNGETKSGLYKLFIPVEWNYEGYIDEYGFPVFRTPKTPVMGIDGNLIEVGVLDHWENEEESLKGYPDELNEFYRQFPRTEAHAFRDDSKSSTLNLTKLYDQIDYNDSYIDNKVLTRGRFEWVNGERDKNVVWVPDPRGRFLISWFPDEKFRNKVISKNGKFYPGNDQLGAFGCDTYDMSKVSHGAGSKASLHGLTMHNVMGVPNIMFFLEYIARPDTFEVFAEDVIKAIRFYGMPILVENNKFRLLAVLKKRGYRAFSLDRPDKPKEKLSAHEKEFGGIPNTSAEVIDTHASCLETYVNKYVGYDREGLYRPPDEIGNMLFNNTLLDWTKFNPSDRTKRDASISSGLAIMACTRFQFSPPRRNTQINLNFATYSVKGNESYRNDID